MTRNDVRIGIVAAMIWLAPYPAGAQVDCDTDWATVDTQQHNCVAFLNRGDPAPFPGSLITAKTGATLGAKLDRCRAQSAADLQKSADLCAADKKMMADMAQAEKDALGAKLAATQAALDEATARDPWWRSKTAIFIYGAVAGGAVLYLGAEIAGKAGN